MPCSWANLLSVGRAADLGGDVVYGPVPGEVFLAEPGGVEVDK